MISNSYRAQIRFYFGSIFRYFWHQTQLGVVHVGKVIWGYYRDKRPWTDLKDYLECVFELNDPDTPAGLGEEFMADMDEPGSIAHGILPRTRDFRDTGEHLQHA
jgi:hypothetical protein